MTARITLLLLLVCVTASGADRHPVPCSRYYLSLIKPSARFRALIDDATLTEHFVDFSAPRPDFHLGNLKDLYSGGLEPAEKMDHSLLLISRDSWQEELRLQARRETLTLGREPFSRTLRLARLSEDGGLAEFRDVFGQRFYYEMEGVYGEPRGLARLQFFRINLTAESRARYFPESGEALLSRRIRKEIPAGDRNELALRLARSQKQVSSTFHLEAGEPLVAANRFLLDRFFSGKNLTIGDLEKLNLLASLEKADKISRPNLGVIRGTSRKFSLGGKTITVDNSSVQLSMGEIVYYLPADEVPEALTALLGRVNRVGPGTSLKEIAEISRGLLSIHPFVDGNGRITKMVQDYMLMKAELPPLPHDPWLTRNFLFLSPEDLELRMREAYAKAGLLE